jgi:CRP/FNR family cyclic AMP-dependent transcriptional regulator
VVSINKIEIDKTSLKNKLSSVLMFQNLDDGEISELSKICEIFQYNKDETVVTQGEVSLYLFGILDGEMGVYMQGVEEKVFMTHIQEGDVFGEASIFMDLERMADVIAESTATLVRISRDKLIDFVNRIPKAGVKIFGFVIFSLFHKLRSANKDLLFEKESNITAKELEKLKKLFPKSIKEMIEE